MSSLGKQLRLPVHVFVLAVFASLNVGCEAGTGGKAITFNMQLAATAGAGDVDDFENNRGWRITLDELKVALGPVYVWENPPAIMTAQAPVHDVFGAVSSWFIPSAHAHAGDVFFSGGEVYGEMLTPIVFDALGEPVSLTGLDGVQGRAASVSVELTPSLMQPSDGLGDVQARVVGTATKAGASVPFSAELAYPGSQLDRTISEIPVDASVDDFGTLFVDIDVPSFFRGAEFDAVFAQLSESGVDRVSLTPEDQPHVQLTRGVQRQSAYVARWQNH